MNIAKPKKITWAEMHSNLIDSFDKIRFDFKKLFATVKIIQNERDSLRQENCELKQIISKLENKKTNKK